MVPKLELNLGKMSVETTCHNAIKLIFSHQDCSAFQGKFYTWQESISHFIKAEAEKSYQQIKTKASVTFVHSFLAGVYVVAVLSLHQTEIFLQDIEENSKFNKDQAIYCNFVIETCCFLLNLNNQKYLKTLSSNCKDHWLNAKRNIFKNFLKKKLKSMYVCATVLSYLKLPIKCITFFGTVTLLSIFVT